MKRAGVTMDQQRPETVLNFARWRPGKFRLAIGAAIYLGAATSALLDMVHTLAPNGP
jgi:hypothetical protein